MSRLLAICVVVALPLGAHAAVLYSTLNTISPDELGQFYNNGAYVSGAASFAAQQSHLANQFVLPAGAGITGYQVDSISVGASLLNGSNKIRFAIVEEENELPGDTALWETTH